VSSGMPAIPGAWPLVDRDAELALATQALGLPAAHSSNTKRLAPSTRVTNYSRQPAPQCLPLSVDRTAGTRRTHWSYAVALRPRDAFGIGLEPVTPVIAATAGVRGGWTCTS
jgi:hypothetical protein